MTRQQQQIKADISPSEFMARYRRDKGAQQVISQQLNYDAFRPQREESEYRREQALALSRIVEGVGTEDAKKFVMLPHLMTQILNRQAEELAALLSANRCEGLKKTCREIRQIVEAEARREKDAIIHEVRIAADKLADDISSEMALNMFHLQLSSHSAVRNQQGDLSLPLAGVVSAALKLQYIAVAVQKTLQAKLFPLAEKYFGVSPSLSPTFARLVALAQEVKDKLAPNIGTKIDDGSRVAIRVIENKLKTAEFPDSILAGYGA